MVGVEFRADLVTLCNDIAERTRRRPPELRRRHHRELDSDRRRRADRPPRLRHRHRRRHRQGHRRRSRTDRRRAVLPQADPPRDGDGQPRRPTSISSSATASSSSGEAEMVTDAMRAMILEYFGYTTKVFEFISDRAHAQERADRRHPQPSGAGTQARCRSSPTPRRISASAATISKRRWGWSEPGLLQHLDGHVPHRLRRVLPMAGRAKTAAPACQARWR